MNPIHHDEHRNRVNCPNCGVRIRRPSMEEIIHCPHCGGSVKRKFGLRGAIGAVKLVGQTNVYDDQDEPGEVLLSRTEAEEIWRREHPDMETNESQAKAPEGRGLRCKNCGAFIDIQEAGYSLRCGSRLSS